MAINGDTVGLDRSDDHTSWALSVGGRMVMCDTVTDSQGVCSVRFTDPETDVVLATGSYTLSATEAGNALADLVEERGWEVSP